MSRANISRHYARILTRWPVDRLRPEIAFQNVLKKRIEAAPSARPFEQNTANIQSQKSDRSSEASEINALYSLLENRYSEVSPLPESMMRPLSAPDYYVNLEKELNELPNRTWFGNFMKRMTNMVRLK